MRTSPLLAMRAAYPLLLRTTPRISLQPTALRKMPQDMPPEGGYEPVQYKVRFALLVFCCLEWGV